MTPGEPDQKATDHQGGQPAMREAALFGLCPRCGARTLFDGIVRFAPRCRACGLDFSQFNVGDGPAAFLILIVGSLVVGLAAWLEVAVSPPWWVHVILWLPLSIVLTLAGLRLAKGALIRNEYRHSAGEAGRREP
ncbi:DUF983 domain-containing protein [Erythrobacter sp. 3-20A1M]|nr:DUF983 domain-containing protein [Erythrobacter sp. 3-20A1M]